MHDFEALRAHRRQLLARDAGFGAKVRHADAGPFVDVLEELERTELAIMEMPAESEDHAAEKLRVISHNLGRGADAEHIAHLAELARLDMARYPSVAA